jgi:hypothetical protein
MARTLDAFCVKCDAIQPHIQETPNHIAHAIGSIVTVGLWLPVWLLIATQQEPCICQRCRSRRRYANPMAANPLPLERTKEDRARDTKRALAIVLVFVAGFAGLGAWAYLRSKPAVPKTDPVLDDMIKRSVQDAIRNAGP